MKFLLDENIGKSLARFLTQLGHTTLRVKVIKPGINDFQVLSLSVERNAILITEDKDFGELVFKNKQTHCGVILLRLIDQTSENTKQALIFLLSKYPRDLESKFVVVTEKTGIFDIRFNKLSRKNF